jgi:signal recognition particle subunit SRP54
MFESLSEKFSSAFRHLSGKGKISESNVRDAMAEVREALLEADVHYDVVNDFVTRVQKQALGTEVLQAVEPGQMMVKVVHDELVRTIGGEEGEDEPKGLMMVSPGPTIIMMSGLQGSGKTTTCGKLAARFKKAGKSVMLAAADLQRPGAVHQLEVLAKQVDSGSPGSAEVTCYSEPDKVAEYGKAVGAAVTVCRNAVAKAKAAKVDVLILDTAGRLHINDELMSELRQVNAAVQPHHILLVIDAMTGQDAVNSAKAFNEQLELDGVILTKFDSDTRGGAALSVRQITGKPIKFIGVGEHMDNLDEFHPERIATRILGMGDVVSLVEKAQEQVSEEEAAELQRKMAEGKMTMDDFLQQLKKIRRMGPMKSILGMLPGIGSQLKNLDLNEKEIDRTEAIIQSMTTEERSDADVLNNSRRRRIARGSGTSQEQVSQLVKGFEMVSMMSRSMSNMNVLSKMRSMAGISAADMAAIQQHSPAAKAKADPRERARQKPKRSRGGGRR